MNQVLQTGKQVRHLLIPLLLASFAIVQSARAVGPDPQQADLIGKMAAEDHAVLDPATEPENAGMGQAANDPNERMIALNVQTPVLQCAPEKVNMHGELHLRFAVGEIKQPFSTGARGFIPVHIKLENVSGTGTSTGRQYLPNNTVLNAFDINVEQMVHNGNGSGHGTFGVIFKMIGKPNPKGDPNPGKDFHFIVEFKMAYEFRINNHTHRLTRLEHGKSPIIKCGR